MKRSILLSALIFLCNMISWGQECNKVLPKITFGAEGGFMPAFISGYHYNFFDPDGFRVNQRRSTVGFTVNGEVSFHVGYNLNTKWNTSLYLGYSGAGSYDPIIPISLRLTRYWGEDHMKDRWFTLFDIGSGICMKQSPQGIASCKLGAGYRLSLSRITKLDFLAAFRMLYTHPQIIHYGEIIEQRWINRNNGYVGSLFIGMSLTF